MFQTVPLSIIRSFSLNGICHTGLLTACEQAYVHLTALIFRSELALRKSLNAGAVDCF